jgi:hypothetical protein
MIITQEKSKQVVQSHDFESVNCTIDPEDMRYVASLLRNNYSNPRLAVVREISANALDANAEANATRKIEIKLPTSMNSTFAVRDFGGGLSQEDVFGLYSKYGKSTKRDSNNYIGAFGIGKFAPLSYGDNFTCVSYHDGWKVAYNVFVNEDDDTKIVKMSDELSDEPSGLRIEVAVADEDINDFREVVQKFFQFFSDEDMPKFLGVEEDFITKKEKILEGKDDSWFILEEKENYYSRHEAHVIMGRVSYPLDRGSVNVDSLVDDDKTRNIVTNLLSMEGFYLRVPLGSVKLHHSRESLEYNKPTQKKIVECLLVSVKEIQEIAKEKLADSNDLWEAKRNYAKIVNAMPHNMRNVLDNSFEWKGIKITSATFDRDYQLADELIITHSWKDSDADSRNGFKVRSQKANRASCQDNYLFIIQDLESAHGNNLRVRTLLNEDENLEGVYILHAKSKVAEDAIWNSWEFNLVDKKHIRYTSNVEKEKPQRSSVRKANGSRAKIPLFVMTDERHIRKNSDYWCNACDDISSVEDDASSVGGNWKGKLIYVPIKSYKIDLHNSDWDLDAMKSRMFKITHNAEDNSTEKDIKLFGVRTGDVKKLDDDIWVNFIDFYSEYAKTTALANLDEVNQVYTSIEIGKSESDGATIRSEHENKLGSLLANDDFKLDFDDSHDLVRAKRLWCECFDRSSENRQIVFFLLEKHKDWCAENLKVQVSAEEFLALLNGINQSYPMLVVLGEAISYWKDICAEDMKAISDYISLCDNSREGEV